MCAMRTGLLQAKGEGVTRSTVRAGQFGIRVVGVVSFGTVDLAEDLDEGRGIAQEHLGVEALGP